VFLADLSPTYTQEDGGYFFDVFPQRPYGRSRIIHWVAILVGCISFALFSRAERNVVEEAADGSRVIQPRVYFKAVTNPTFFAMVVFEGKLKALCRFVTLPRVFLSVIGGAFAPIIAHTYLTELTVATASGTSVLGAGILISGLSLTRYGNPDSEIPSVAPWENLPDPDAIWRPGAVLVLLTVHSLFYFATTRVPGLYYESLEFYSVLFFLSIPLCWLTLRLVWKGNVRDDISLLFPAVHIPAMVALGIIIHLPWASPVVPDYLLFGARHPVTGSQIDGAIYAVSTVGWHVLLIAVIDTLLVGWDVTWHKRPTPQPVPYTVWSTLLGAGVGVVLWSIWPGYQAPVIYHEFHQSLILGLVLFTYSHGVLVEPVTD